MTNLRVSSLACKHSLSSLLYTRADLQCNSSISKGYEFFDADSGRRQKNLRVPIPADDEQSLWAPNPVDDGHGCGCRLRPTTKILRIWFYLLSILII